MIAILIILIETVFIQWFFDQELFRNKHPKLINDENDLKFMWYRVFCAKKKYLCVRNIFLRVIKRDPILNQAKLPIIKRTRVCVVVVVTSDY